MAVRNRTMCGAVGKIDIGREGSAPASPITILALGIFAGTACSAVTRRANNRDRALRSPLHQPQQIAPKHCQVVEKIEDSEESMVSRRWRRE